MRVDIVPVGEVPADVKREGSAALRSVYDCDVRVTENQPVPTGAYNEEREQYRAEDFIQVAHRAGNGEKNIAVTTEDLYYHRRNYVFGLAYLDGEGSVISTYRLEENLDRPAADGGATSGSIGRASNGLSDGGFSERDPNEIFADRVRKEVVHEIGHTFGLEHCSNNRCVMSFSPTVREVDRKKEHLCGSCSREVL